MAQTMWQTQKICYCERVGHEIKLETRLVYPAEHLPEQAPRVLAHRCSNAFECNAMEKMVCAYCGSNPDYKPL